MWKAAAGYFAKLAETRYGEPHQYLRVSLRSMDAGQTKGQTANGPRNSPAADFRESPVG